MTGIYMGGNPTGDKESITLNNPYRFGFMDDVHRMQLVRLLSPNKNKGAAQVVLHWYLYRAWCAKPVKLNKPKLKGYYWIWRNYDEIARDTMTTERMISCGARALVQSGILIVPTAFMGKGKKKTSLFRLSDEAFKIVGHFSRFWKRKCDDYSDTQKIRNAKRQHREMLKLAFKPPDSTPQCLPDIFADWLESKNTAQWISNFEETCKVCGEVGASLDLYHESTAQAKSPKPVPPKNNKPLSAQETVDQGTGVNMPKKVPYTLRERMIELWRDHYKEEHGEKMPLFINKKKGQMGLLIKALRGVEFTDTDCMQYLQHTLEHWNEYVERAEFYHGLKNTPMQPKVAFLLLYVDTSLELYHESLKAKKPVQTIVPVMPVSPKPVIEEKPYVSMKDEILAQVAAAKKAEKPKF